MAVIILQIEMQLVHVVNSRIYFYFASKVRDSLGPELMLSLRYSY